MLRWETYACEAPHVPPPPWPLLNTQGPSHVTFDTWHTVELDGGGLHLPNATREQREAHLLASGWVKVTEPRPGYRRSPPQWFCPYHADPARRRRVPCW